MLKLFDIDIISVGFQYFNFLLTFLTTIILGFGAWIAYLQFLKTPEQTPSSAYDEQKPFQFNMDNAYELIVFQTSTQTTTLKTRGDGLECHLKDTRPEKPSGLQWSFSKAEANAILNSKNYGANSGSKVHTGVFSIGPRKNWLYSKKLFPEPYLLYMELGHLLKKASGS